MKGNGLMTLPCILRVSVETLQWKRDYPVNPIKFGVNIDGDEGEIVRFLRCSSYFARKHTHCLPKLYLYTFNEKTSPIPSYYICFTGVSHYENLLLHIESYVSASMIENESNLILGP